MLLDRPCTAAGFARHDDGPPDALSDTACRLINVAQCLHGEHLAEIFADLGQALDRLVAREAASPYVPQVNHVLAQSRAGLARLRVVLEQLVGTDRRIVLVAEGLDTSILAAGTLLELLTSLLLSGLDAAQSRARLPDLTC